ncbi:hypothetical protein [Methylobacterium oxalidis]|uniref:hypothetical protein n=1 Tax=Methylobacterium oxalidis TaxID=944322 RepID=UPI003314CA8B
MRRLVVTLAAGAALAGLATPADAFWVARGWRGGVAAGGIRAPVLAREALLARCWRCAPAAAALAGTALAGAAVAGAAAGTGSAAPPAGSSAPAAAAPAQGSGSGSGSNSGASPQVVQAGGGAGGGAGNAAANHCAAGLPSDSRIIYDASLRNMKSLDTLRDTVVAQTRSLVEAGKLNEAEARPAAEKAGTCLRMLASP